MNDSAQDGLAGGGQQDSTPDARPATAPNVALLGEEPITIEQPPKEFGGGDAGGGPQTIDIEQQKSSWANIIALVIVGTFSAVILLTLLIALGVLWKSGDPNRVKLFADAITPIYDSVGKFIPTVFGSLMAFILGYYYSKEHRK